MAASPLAQSDLAAHDACPHDFHPCPAPPSTPLDPAGKYVPSEAYVRLGCAVPKTKPRPNLTSVVSLPAGNGTKVTAYGLSTDWISTGYLACP